MGGIYYLRWAVIATHDKCKHPITIPGEPPLFDGVSFKQDRLQREDSEKVLLLGLMTDMILLT